MKKVFQNNASRFFTCLGIVACVSFVSCEQDGADKDKVSKEEASKKQKFITQAGNTGLSKGDAEKLWKLGIRKVDDIKEDDLAKVNIADSDKRLILKELNKKKLGKTSTVITDDPQKAKKEDEVTVIIGKGKATIKDKNGEKEYVFDCVENFEKLVNALKNKTAKTSGQKFPWESLSGYLRICDSQSFQLSGTETAKDLFTFLSCLVNLSKVKGFEGQVDGVYFVINDSSISFYNQNDKEQKQPQSTFMVAPFNEEKFWNLVADNAAFFGIDEGYAIEEKDNHVVVVGKDGVVETNIDWSIVVGEDGKVRKKGWEKIFYTKQA